MADAHIRPIVSRRGQAKHPPMGSLYLFHMGEGEGKKKVTDPTKHMQIGSRRLEWEREKKTEEAHTNRMEKMPVCSYVHSHPFL